MSNKYCLVTTTCADAAEAKKISRSLVEARLCACVQMFPINSVYVWKGEVRDENEAALFIKCRREDYEEIEREILRNHSYELPEIALLPIEGGLPGYLDWLEEAARERQVINES